MMKMITNNKQLVGLALVLLLAWTPALASNETDVRNAVQSIFQSLKNKDYGALYDSLPSDSRARMTKERFTGALRRSQDNYALDRMDVGAVKVAGNFAVVDTTLYGRLMNPLNLEGKIVVQQYLVREDGKWKVATGDNSAIQRFLKGNPSFAHSFKIHPPRVYVKKDNNWVEFTPPKARRKAEG